MGTETVVAGEVASQAPPAPRTTSRDADTDPTPQRPAGS